MGRSPRKNGRPTWLPPVDFFVSSREAAHFKALHFPAGIGTSFPCPWKSLEGSGPKGVAGAAASTWPCRMRHARQLPQSATRTAPSRGGLLSSASPLFQRCCSRGEFADFRQQFFYFGNNAPVVRQVGQGDESRIKIFSITPHSSLNLRYAGQLHNLRRIPISIFPTKTNFLAFFENSERFYRIIIQMHNIAYCNKVRNQ